MIGLGTKLLLSKHGRMVGTAVYHNVSASENSFAYAPSTPAAVLSLAQKRKVRKLRAHVQRGVRMCVADVLLNGIRQHLPRTYC